MGDDDFSKKVLNKHCAPASRITLDELVKVACKEYQMDESDLAVADRTHLTSEARCVIGWLAQQYDQIALT